MIGILNGIKNIIGMFKSIFDMIMSGFKMLILMFEYLVKIITILGDVAISSPLWLKTFISITAAVSVIYLILGRNTGKSE